MSKQINVTVIGGGMITHDLILPAVYHLQRSGIVDQIDICALDSEPLRLLATSEHLKEAFPDQTFHAHPSLNEPAVETDAEKDEATEWLSDGTFVAAEPPGGFDQDRDGDQDQHDGEHPLHRVGVEGSRHPCAGDGVCDGFSTHFEQTLR